MNRGLRNEVALVAGLTAGALALTKNNKSALGFGLLALGLKLFPFKPDFNFRNRSVIITGGSRGLGLALAQEFLNEGAQVSILARDQEELEKARKLLKDRTGLMPSIYVCDVTIAKDLSQTFSNIHSAVGEIDILINNAGAVMAAPIEAMDPVDYHSLMDIHFFAIQNACDMLIPYFKQKGEGHIVNISSIGGKIPAPHLSSYTASKFAVGGYSQTAAAELHQYGIKVTTVYPGLLRTGSPVQGIFKGDAEKEYAWFSLSDHTPGLSTSAITAAQEIVNAVRFGQTELVISLPAKVAKLGFSLFPEIFTSMMSLANRFLPNGLSKEYHSGAASKDWIENKFKPLRIFREKLGAEYNQKETFY